MSVDTKSITEGTVFQKARGHYRVHTAGRVLHCTISSKLRKELIYPEADPSSRRQRVDKVKRIEAVDPVAIGDMVAFTDSGDGTGMITAVLPRRNKISRTAPKPPRREQVIVANVDQVVVVFAAAFPTQRWGMLDRHLVTAEATALPALVCLTKMDLVNPKKLRADARVYERAGYRLLPTSAVTGEGIEDLRAALRDRISILVGKSGVGKTTLLNTLQPDLGLKVKAVSEKTGKGMHTTTHLEMHELIGGGAVVDTPGMREFALWNVDLNRLDEYFREMRRYLGRCRFNPCTHVHEPGCAIRKAVDAGRLAPHRYRSYLRMREDPEDRRQRWIEVSKNHRKQRYAKKNRFSQQPEQ